MKSVVEDLATAISGCLKLSVNSLPRIVLVLALACPYLTVLVYGKNKESGLAVPLFLLGLCAYLMSVYSKHLNTSKSRLVRPRRFTRKNYSGNVEIDVEDIQEIILYLNEVEDYFESGGKLSD